MRGRTDKQGQARSLGPANRSTRQCGALRSLSLSVDPGPGPQSLSCGPRGQGSPLPLCRVGQQGWGRLCTYLLGQTARKQAGPGEEEGGRKSGVPPRAAGGGREGCAAGGTERAGNSREKHTEREGGREREENQLHPHEGVMARPCPSGEAQDAELAMSTSQRQCLTPAPLPGSIPAGQALCCHGDDGAVITKRQKRKPPVRGPRWPWGPISTSRTYLCDLRTTTCPLWTPIWRSTQAHTFLLQSDLLLGSLWSRKKSTAAVNTFINHLFHYNRYQYQIPFCISLFKRCLLLVSCAALWSNLGPMPPLPCGCGTVTEPQFPHPRNGRESCGCGEVGPSAVWKRTSLSGSCPSGFLPVHSLPGASLDLP